MKHIKIIITAFSVIFIQSAFAQRNFVTMGQTVDGVPIMLEYNIEGEDKKIEGSTYLFEEWKPVVIKRSNGVQFEAQAGNYHTYLNELIIQLDNKFHRLHDSRQIEYFVVEERKFINLSLKPDKTIFAELLVDSDRIQVFKTYECHIKKGKPSQGIIDATNDEYVRYEQYIVRSKTDVTRVSELKVKKKGASLKNDDVFPELALFLKQFKKENFKDHSNLKNILSQF